MQEKGSSPQNCLKGVSLKIGIVCYPTLGGSGVMATELGQQLAFKGHEVHFITYEPPFRLKLDEKNIFFHKVEINQYELFKYPDYALTLAVQIAHVAKNCQLDLIHVHYAIPHAASAFLAKQLLKTSPKVITTLHGTDITLVGKDPAYHDIVKFSIEASDGVSCVSNHLRLDTCRLFNICCNVEVIYNFFIPQKELIGKKPLKDLFVGEEEFLILHSSNFRSVKRPVDVFRTFQLITDSVKAKLLLIGTGTGLETIREMAHEANMEEKVIFLGKSLDVDPYTASADLFLLPSEQESFGLAALEAMAYGVPVVATNVGGLPELIKNGETGFLSPIGDVGKMAEDSLRLLKDRKLYERFSQAGTARAKDLFSVEKILPQYESFYNSILRRTMPI